MRATYPTIILASTFIACRTSCLYKITKEGKENATANIQISTSKNIRSIGLCTDLCTQTAGCLSVNYHKTSGTCEVLAALNNSNWIQDKSWSFAAVHERVCKANVF